MNKMVAAAERKLPAGTRVYRTDTIVVHSGDEVAIYAASSSVTRTSDGVTVHDAQSGQTFHFAPAATIQVVQGGGKAYVVPGGSLPDWAAGAHARLERSL